MKFFKHLINAFVVFYEINTFSLTKELLNQPIFEPQTKLNFSSSNPNNFYVLTSNTITDKYTLVRDFRKLFQQGFLLAARFSLAILTKLTYIHIL